MWTVHKKSKAQTTWKSFSTHNTSEAERHHQVLFVWFYTNSQARHLVTCRRNVEQGHQGGVGMLQHVTVWLSLLRSYIHIRRVILPFVCCLVWFYYALVWYLRMSRDMGMLCQMMIIVALNCCVNCLELQWSCSCDLDLLLWYCDVGLSGNQERRWVYNNYAWFC